MLTMSRETWEVHRNFFRGGGKGWTKPFSRVLCLSCVIFIVVHGEHEYESKSQRSSFFLKVDRQYKLAVILDYEIINRSFCELCKFSELSRKNVKMT